MKPNVNDETELSNILALKLEWRLQNISFLTNVLVKVNLDRN